MIWFTADTHFGHANVLRFTDRHERWNTIEQMDTGFVANINSCVAPGDDLYVLGDFSFKLDAEQARAIRERIRCKNVHLVPGNHDKDWEGLGHGSIHLHGHIHAPAAYNEWNRANRVLRFDVGVDANGYLPVSLGQVRVFFKGVEHRHRVSREQWLALARAGELEVGAGLLASELPDELLPESVAPAAASLDAESRGGRR